jgi:hypothetical protein
VVERNLNWPGDAEISSFDVSSGMRSAAAETDGRRAERPTNFVLDSTGLTERVDDVAELVGSPPDRVRLRDIYWAMASASRFRMRDTTGDSADSIDGLRRGGVADGNVIVGEESCCME